MVFQALSNLTRLRSRANEEAQPELQRTACAMPPMECAPARPAPHVQGRRKGKKSVEDTPRRTRGSASRAGRGWPISHFHRAPAFRRKHLNIKKKAVCTAFLFVIDLEIRRRLPYTLRLPALLVSRIRPEDGIVDVVLESVSCSLRHIVIE